MIYYSKVKYKYRLEEDVCVPMPLSVWMHHAFEPFTHDFINLEFKDRSYCLIIKAGYAWNGANCVPDTKRVMKASLVHDAMYQLIELYGGSANLREQADWWFGELCKESGMTHWLADLYVDILIDYWRDRVPTPPRIYVTS